MNIILNIYLLFMLFSNVLFNLLGFPDFLGYWDELITLGIIAWTILNVFREGKIILNKSHRTVFWCIIGVVFIGILGNIVFGYVPNTGAIFKDIIGFIKFPLILFILLNSKLEQRFVISINAKTMTFIKIIITVIFVLGIISLFKDIGLSQNEIRHGIKPYQFLFSHPTYLVLSNICMLGLVESYNKIKNRWIYEMMLVITIMLTLRTKGIAVAIAFLFIKYIGTHLRKFKILYVGLAGTLILAVAYDKLALYNSWASSPREVLYRGSLELIRHCFPIGSGFASYASHISWEVQSAVYEFIKIPFYFENGMIQTAVLGDAGFAYYIGQFGILGFMLCVVLFCNMYKISVRQVNRKTGILILWIYILIALTTEATLTNNGIELAFILSIASALAREPSSGDVRTISDV